MSNAHNEMTHKVISVNQNDSLRLAYKTMVELEIRHLPVVNDGKLIGIVSDRDILKAGENNAGGAFIIPDASVETVMNEEIVTCNTSTPLAKVAWILLEEKISALPVTDSSQKIVGIITSTDLIKYMAKSFEKKWQEIPISQIQGLGYFI